MKRIMLMFVAMVVALGISAQTTETEFYDGANSVAPYSAVKAFYNVTKSGNVHIEVAGDYLDVAVNGEAIAHSSHIATGNKYIYNIKNVSQGERVTFSNAFVLNNIIVTITPLGEDVVMPIKLVDATPASGSQFSWSHNGQITLLFNMAVNTRAAYIVIGSERIEAENLHIGGAYVSCDVQSVLTNALKRGQLKVGDEFKVRFEGVADASDESNLCNGDGVLELSYTAPGLQTELVSTSFGTTMKSFYAANDAEGVFTMTFNDALSTDPKRLCSATLTFGDIDLAADNLYYRETLPVTISGNSLSIDLRGKIRTVRSMLSGDPTSVNTDVTSIDIEHVTLSVTGIVDANGNFVSSPGQGTIGSFSYQLKLIMPDLTNFICEVTPQSSVLRPVTIKPGDKLEFWYSDATLFTLGTPGGFSFTYGEGEEMVVDSLLLNYLREEYNSEMDETFLVPATNGTDLITVGEVDSYDGRSIWLTVPKLPLAEGAMVKIAPVGIVTADGVDHCLEYAQTYKYGGSTNGIKLTQNEDSKKQNSYSVSGVHVGENFRGIVIKNGKAKLVVK